MNLFHPVSTAVICRLGNALRTVGDGHWLTRPLLPGYLLPQPQRCGPSAVALPASSGQAVTMVMCQVVTSCDKLLCLCCPWCLCISLSCVGIDVQQWIQNIEWAKHQRTSRSARAVFLCLSFWLGLGQSLPLHVRRHFTRTRRTRQCTRAQYWKSWAADLCFKAKPLRGCSALAWSQRTGAIQGTPHSLNSALICVHGICCRSISCVCEVEMHVQMTWIIKDSAVSHQQGQGQTGHTMTYKSIACLCPLVFSKREVSAAWPRGKV